LQGGAKCCSPTLPLFDTDARRARFSFHLLSCCSLYLFRSSLKGAAGLQMARVAATSSRAMCFFLPVGELKVLSRSSSRATLPERSPYWRMPAARSVSHPWRQAITPLL